MLVTCIQDLNNIPVSQLRGNNKLDTEKDPIHIQYNGVIFTYITARFVYFHLAPISLLRMSTSLQNRVDFAVQYHDF